MFRIAICENEKIFANKMKSIVSAYMEEIKLSYEINLYYSGEKFVKLGAEMLNYKVIFLDINMKGLDGLETARIIRKYNDDIFIVFVTAYINYALEGYRFNATRYLLKEKNMFREYVYECLDTIIQKANYVTVQRDILFREGRKRISLNHLMYIASDGHTLEFHFMEEKSYVYTVYGSLSNFEKEYEHYNFIRIHTSFLVNLRHIIRIERYMATISNGAKLSINRARFKQIEEAFITYTGDL
ncbi:MAG: LytR/AlgR family response regulator transcription factor [Lachnospiraceae bacterium]